MCPLLHQGYLPHMRKRLETSACRCSLATPPSAPQQQLWSSIRCFKSKSSKCLKNLEQKRQTTRLTQLKTMPIEDLWASITTAIQAQDQSQGSTATATQALYPNLHRDAPVQECSATPLHRGLLALLVAILRTGLTHTTGIQALFTGIGIQAPFTGIVRQALEEAFRQALGQGLSAKLASLQQTQYTGTTTAELHHVTSGIGSSGK